MSFIQSYRQKYPEYDDLSDHQLTTALHRKYQADTGEQVSIEEFGREIGHEIITKPLSIPSQVSEPAANDIQGMDHGDYQEPTINDGLGQQPQGEQLINDLNQLPPHSGLDQVDAPAIIDRVQQKIGPLPAKDSFNEALIKAVKNVPEMFQKQAGGFLQYLGEKDSGFNPLSIHDYAKLINPEAYKPQTKFGKQIKEDIKNINKARKEILTKAGKEIQEDAKATMEPVNVEPQSPAYYGSAVVSSLANMAPALLAGVLTRNPGVTLSMIGTQSKGGSYAEGREEGLSPEDADAYSTATALAETIPEILPVSILLKPGQKIFGKVVKGSLAEILQEEITEALQIGIDREYIHPDMTWQEARQRLIDAGVVAGIAGPIQSAATHYPVEYMDKRAAFKGAMEDIDSMQVDEQYVDEQARQALAPQEFQTLPRIQAEENQPFSQGEFTQGLAPSDTATLPPYEPETMVAVEDNEVVEDLPEEETKELSLEPELASDETPVDRTQIIIAKSGNPFKTESAARSNKENRLLNNQGFETEIIEQDGGFAIKVESEQERNDRWKNQVIESAKELGTKYPDSDYEVAVSQGNFARELQDKLNIYRKRVNIKDVINVSGGLNSIKDAFKEGQKSAISTTSQAEITSSQPGLVGMKLAEGESVLTTTGRQTTPYPKIDTSTPRKTDNTLKRIDNWLMQNALDEAEARGDEFNARQFRQNLKNPSTADKDSAEYYLFDKEFLNRNNAPDNEIHKPVKDEIIESGQIAVENTADSFASPKTALHTMKRDLLKSVDEKIEINKDREARGYKPDGFVEFNVEGDGKFRVRNSAEGLEAFKKKITKYWKEPNLKPKKDRFTNDEALLKMLKAGRLDMAKEYAKQIGFKGDLTAFAENRGVNFKKAYETKSVDYGELTASKTEAQLDSISEPPDQLNSMQVNMTPGQNYAGNLSDTPYSRGAATANEDVKPSKKPLRREDILIPLLKEFKMPVYTGRVKKKGTLGFYRPKEQSIRTRSQSDLEVTAHELAHHIDNKLWGGEKWHQGNQPWKKGANAKVYAEELKTISYDKKLVYEGFAEFVRHWMTRPDIARSAAPKFYRHWESIVNTMPEGKAILKARESMMDWYAQSGTDRAKSKIGETKNINKEVLDNFWDEARQSIFDRTHGVLLAEQAATGEKSAIVDGPYESFRLAAGAFSVVDGALRWGPPKKLKRDDGSTYYDFTDREGNTSTLYETDASGKTKVKDNGNYKSWGLEDVLAPVASEQDDFIQFAVGMSANELKGQGRENLFDQVEINEMIKKGKGKPHFYQVLEDYQKWNNKVVDFAQEMGLINPSNRANWQRSIYLPFYRVGTKTGKKFKGGVDGNVSVARALTGGTGNLKDIMDNMVQNASKLISEGIKNKARLDLIEFAEKHGGLGRYFTKIPKDNVSVKIDTPQVRDKFLESLGINPSQYRKAQGLGQSDPNIDIMLDKMVANMGDMAQFWLHGQSPKGSDIFAVMRNGKPEFYQVSHDNSYLLRALQSLSPQGRHPVIKVMNRAKRVGQASITLTLDFMAANMWRDTWHGWAFSKHGFKPVVDSFAGMAHRMKNDAVYRQFIANGGGMSSYLIEEGDMKKHLQRFYSKKGINKATVAIDPGAWLYWLETLADATEVGTRLGEFNQAIKRGESPRHAAYSGREISSDFAMRGDSDIANMFYDTVLFLKAGMNGLDRAYRGLTKDSNSMEIWGKAAMIAGASAALYALMLHGDEEYEALEDWDKDSHWHLFIPKSLVPFFPDDWYTKSERLHLRFPKIWEIGAIASTAERSMGAFLDSQENQLTKEEAAKLAKRIGHIMSEQLKMDWVPYIGVPIYEVYGLNKSRFSEREILPPHLEKLEPFAQYTPYTNKTLVNLAELTKDLPKELQFSPKRAEALVRGYLNIWGMYGLMIADEALYGDKIPDRKSDEYPVWRRFHRAHPLKRTKYETEFWKLYDDAVTLYNTGNTMIDKFKPEIAEKKLKDSHQKYVDVLRDVKQTAMEINKQMTLIYMSEKLSSAQKREQIDKLQIQKNELFKKTIDRISE